MSGDIENCLRELFRSVLLQVMRESAFPIKAGSPSQAKVDLSQRILLRSSEAARLLAISPRTLHDLTRTGVLQCVRVGRSVRYSPKILEEWVNRSHSKDTDTAEPNTDSHVSNTRRDILVPAANRLADRRTSRRNESPIQKSVSSK